MKQPSKWSPICIDTDILDGFEEDLVYIDLRKEVILVIADIMMKKLKDIYPDEEVVISKVWITTFGHNIENFLENCQLYNDVPSAYLYLCDWLEKDLINHLSKVLSIKAFKLLERSKYSEIVFINVGFKWNSEMDSLDLNDIG